MCLRVFARSPLTALTNSRIHSESRVLDFRVCAHSARSRKFTALLPLLWWLAVAGWLGQKVPTHISHSPLCGFVSLRYVNYLALSGALLRSEIRADDVGSLCVALCVFFSLHVCMHGCRYVVSCVRNLQLKCAPSFSRTQQRSSVARNRETETEKSLECSPLARSLASLALGWLACWRLCLCSSVGWAIYFDINIPNVVVACRPSCRFVIRFGVDFVVVCWCWCVSTSRRVGTLCVCAPLLLWLPLCVHFKICGAQRNAYSNRIIYTNTYIIYRI